MLEKELVELGSNRAFWISVITQIFLVFVMVFLYKTYASIDQTKVPITVEVNANDTKLIRALNDSGINVVVVENKSQSQRNAFRGSSQPVARIDVENKTIKSDSSNILSGIAIARIKVASRIKSLEELLEENDFELNVEYLGKKANDFAQMAYSLIIPLIIFFPAIVSMTLASQNILLEKKKKTIELYLVSPINTLQILLVKTIPLILVSTTTTILLIMIASNDIKIMNYPLLIAVSFLVGIMGTSLGIIISATSRTIREANATSAIIAIMVVSVMVFPSGLTLYLPHTIAARAAVTALDETMFHGLLINIVAACGSLAMAYLAISGMRKNYY